MEKRSKRQYRRIDKALNELEQLLHQKGNESQANPARINSILNFILKEYCQDCDGLDILSNSDFKDYLLMIFANNCIPVDTATILLSILNNCSNNKDFFTELLLSPFIEITINQFLRSPQLYFRSLRFLTLCLSQSKDIMFIPNDNIKEVWSYCINLIDRLPSNDCSSMNLVQQYLSFFVKYIDQFTKSISNENHSHQDLIEVIMGLFELNKKNDNLKLLDHQRVSVILKFGNIYCDKSDHEILLSYSIEWLSSMKTHDSFEQLLSIYQETDILKVCYLHQNIRNSVFYHILSCASLSKFHRSVLKILYNMCSQGSYRIYLVDETFCVALLTFLAERSDNPDNILCCIIIIDIFLTFNPKQSLHEIAIQAGLVKAILVLLKNMTQYASIHSEICRSVPKFFYLLEKSTKPDRSDLDHASFHVLLQFLKSFNNINCLNFLLSVTITATYIHLCAEGFVSLVFYNLRCYKLNQSQLHFAHPPLKSVPRSYKSINKLHECGWLLISNIINCLPKSTQSIITSINKVKELSAPNANCLSNKHINIMCDFILLIRFPSLVAVFHNIFKRYDIIRGSSLDNLKQLIMNICHLIKWRRECVFSVMPAEDCEEYDNSPVGSTDTVQISNGCVAADVNREILFRSSLIFRTMFKHCFRESKTNQVTLSYLSNECIMCLIDLLHGKKLRFNNDDMRCEAVSYPLDVLLELIPIVTMFEIQPVFRVIESYFEVIETHPEIVVLKIVELAFRHNSPLWLIFVSNSLSCASFDTFDKQVILTLLEELRIIVSNLLDIFSL